MTTEQAPERPDQLPDAHTARARRRRAMLLMLAIFFVALGARLLIWQHHRADIEAVMTGLTAGYKADARHLTNGEWGLFLRGPNPPVDANVLAHPPGYALLMASVRLVFGESDAALRFVQIALDALAAALVFLLALRLLPTGAALLAGALVALSPQLGYNSLLLLPDSAAIPPVLVALYLIVSAAARPSILRFAAAGALVGVSCWLRPNALLLTFFLAALALFLFRDKGGWRYALALVGATLLVIAPLTIRNAVVFQSFIPLSLGSGVTFVEGIADYDEEGHTGLPRTDMELLRWEAEKYGRADYAGSLYNPDGIERERARVRHGINAIAERPLWFAGVVLRRSASMLRWERVPAIAGSPLQLGANAGAGSASLTASLLRYPAILLKAVQKLFVTALMLPLSLLGLWLLLRHQRRALAILLVVPAYYLLAQSLLHTEYRYVITLQYFLLTLAAYALYRVGLAALRRVKMAGETNGPTIT